MPSNFAFYAARMSTLPPTRLATSLRLSVFVDADNIPATQAGAILALARRHGAPDLVRANGNACKLPAWDEAPGVHLVHSGSGKNAADMLICLDAMERALSGECEAVLLVSSDHNFTHLATRLRGYGLAVIGAGESKTAERFRAACCRFEELEPPRLPCAVPSRPVEPCDLDRCIRTVIEKHSKDATGLKVQTLGILMYRQFGIQISRRPEKTWRAYLEGRSVSFALDPKGPNAKVRNKPAAFGTPAT
ncbi:NYN domain-containing protein [Roseovarius nitratireducens]|uniref:NYN domain-containing protein n=1 Tax=Roseovarius nitratireducens TaxID=2044597 RepID=UPI001F0C11A5|nr:NYN domain-containing protein [Roseovarius nitratireducens]